MTRPPVIGESGKFESFRRVRAFKTGKWRISAWVRRLHCSCSVKAWVSAFLIILSNVVELSAKDDPFREASLYLGGIEGLELREGDRGEMILRGEVQRQSDLKKIKVFLRDFPQVKNQTTLAPEAGLQVERALEKRLKLLDPRAKLERRGNGFVIRGTESRSVLDSLHKIHPSVSFDGVGSDGIRLGPEATVFLEVALVEVKRSALNRLGIRLGSPIGVSTNIGLQFSQGSSSRLELSSDPIRGFLDLALQSGEARVHSKQSIVSQNGKRGTFMAGGEFPIKVVSGLVAKVEFKRFGLILAFTPQLNSKGLVHLDIDSEMSDIDMGSNVDGIPVVLKKELRTQLFAKLDQTIAIAGLVENRQSRFTDSIPGLSALPGLGRLFESEDFKRNRSEAYVFVVPRLMKSPWLPSPEL